MAGQPLLNALSMEFVDFLICDHGYHAAADSLGESLERSIFVAGHVNAVCAGPAHRTGNRPVEPGKRLVVQYRKRALHHSPSISPGTAFGWFSRHKFTQ